MIVFAWNYRCLGQTTAICDLRALLRLSSPNCVILMETKINSNSMNRLLVQLNFPFNVYVPPIGLAGGLCVAWREGIDMEPITTTKNVISLLVFSNLGSPPWLFSVIYGPTSYVAKRLFWEDILGIRQIVSLVLG